MTTFDPIDWDDLDNWGGTVHIAAWAPDKHDLTEAVQ